MTPQPQDTIAAIATPPGRGGVGVVRVSGPGVPSLIPAVLGKNIPARYAHFGPFLDDDGSAIDRGLALYFPAPRSFTGEAVLELHGHGSPILLDLLLERLILLGVRLARPGEFSERAFLNDKLDLAQAEAIADLINSTTKQAARSAQRSLEGEFSRHIHVLVESLIELRLYVEASIDFTDEDIDFMGSAHIADNIASLAGRLETIRATARQGSLLRDGMTLVIAGRPNAGKSSLLNRLAGRDSAIVTDQPGTTRDTLREYIQLDGMPLHIIDTAGLRDSVDLVEREGIRRARSEIENADRVLLVIDGSAPEEGENLIESLPAGVPITRVYNKIDITTAPASLTETAEGTVIKLSAKSGEGMPLLLQHLKNNAGFESETDGVFIARRRHLDAIDQARTSIKSAELRRVTGEYELLAEDLRHAQNALSSITGEFTSDDLLGRIFASFCIGK
jgi:tRNA modification GTPase